jgi:pSer/pThr/pTyr-binding forkhead associated (FHA) protein
MNASTPLEEDARVSKVGFAKIIGKDLDYVVNKYDIVLGRQNKNRSVDVSLGDVKSVSRQHARIFYDFEKKAFFLMVLGKNGVMVDSIPYGPQSEPIRLRSQSRIQVGSDVSLHFLLPKKLSRAFNCKRKRKADDAQLQDAAPPPPGPPPSSFLNAFLDGIAGNATNNSYM